MLAMTGVITSTTAKHSLLTLLQDMEYMHGQLFERAVESGCGAVTCLPGALTMLRFSAFRKMAKHYFADKAEQCNDLFDYGKFHLGEDRWLTHLFMIGAKKRYQIQMNTGAFCKTEAVQTFKSLLKQRRRWFLGFITNEVCMLTDIRLWKRYPLLLIMRLAQNTIRTTALLFFIMVIALVTTAESIETLPFGFIAVSLGLNWLLMIFFGVKLGRWKAFGYPLMFVVNPFMNWLYMVYGICTAGQRTWGGPRADAGKADETTTPAQAIAEAEKMGDDLNVVPETFRPALEATAHRLPHQAPLLPSIDLYGRFIAAEEMPGGFFKHRNPSREVPVERAPWADDDLPDYNRGARDSFDSTLSDGSIYQPRRVESMFDDPRQVWKYQDRRAQQREPGGAHYETGMLEGDAFSPHLDNAARYQAGFGARRRDSDSSDDSVSLHFAIPKKPSAIVDEKPASSTPPPRDGGCSPAQRLFGRRNREASAGRSPLARKSFTRLASPPPLADAPPVPPNAAEVIQLERLVAERARQSREEQSRGRQREAEQRRPRKLSKQRPESRQSKSRSASRG